MLLLYCYLTAIFKTAGGTGMAIVAVSISILPYILVAIKASF